MVYANIIKRLRAKVKKAEMKLGSGLRQSVLVKDPSAGVMRPFEHDLHAESDVALMMGLYVPMGHRLNVEEPTTATYEPGGASWHRGALFMAE